MNLVLVVKGVGGNRNDFKSHSYHGCLRFGRANIQIFFISHPWFCVFSSPVNVCYQNEVPEDTGISHRFAVSVNHIKRSLSYPTLSLVNHSQFQALIFIVQTVNELGLQIKPQFTKVMNRCVLYPVCKMCNTLRCHDEPEVEKSTGRWIREN